MIANKRVLLIDNYDSFTYNLVHAVEAVIDQAVAVKKNDQISLEEIAAYEYLILSPGPGLPDEAGKLKEVIRMYGPTKKILGVCLGLQAIGEVYGCQLKNLNQVYHGMQSVANQISESKILKGLPSGLIVGRYHSWVIDQETLVDDLVITATDAAGQIMSIEHKQHKVYGVQYHPESIMTPDGSTLLTNFLSIA